VLWPTDLPAPPLEGPARHSLPPVSHPAFSAGVKDSFWQTEAESYVVAFGKFDSIVRLKRALAAWSWAAEALGEDWSLRVAGLSSAGDAQLQRLQAEMGIAGTIQAIHPHSVADSAHCLLRAGAVLNLGPVHPWGDRVLHTLAAGRPLAAEYDWGVNERVGPAAYVTPAGDSRALGAALLTLLVEESVATQVNQAAQERTAAWASEGFLDQLMTIYREVQAGEPRRITST
jgi:glycosyltransferase involved in cell wall biosynthesis